MIVHSQRSSLNMYSIIYQCIIINKYKLNSMMLEEQTQSQVQFMDSHTHLLDYPTHQDIDEVIKNAISQKVEKMVVNTTTTDQFHGMLALLKKYPKHIVAGFGIHPYFLNKQQKIEEIKKSHVEDLNQQVQHITWLNELEEILKRDNSYTVGQIGLDFRKNVLEANPKQLQMHYFKAQLELAIRLDRPATIHCVRAHGEMLKMLKQLNKSFKIQSKPHLIMHSYGGSEEITKSMLKLQNLNIYFSMCLKRTGQLCSVIPIQKLICQTDAPCQNSVELLEQHTRVSFNKYLHKIKMEVEGQQNLKSLQNEQRMAKIGQILKSKQTNEPVNVIANIKSLVKYYGVDENRFMNIIYNNSLRAFKLLK